MNNLAIIDGNNWANRAYYSLKNLKNSQGVPTGAIFGFKNMFKQILDNYKNICVCFDGKGNNPRYDIYPNYKDGRSHKPELYPQFKYIFRYLECIGVPYMISEIYEADDYINTIVKLSKDKFHQIHIFSNDKDLHQLVNDEVIQFTANSRMGLKEIQHKFGISPNFMIDYLSIVGDTSDNIPGCRGIGKISAVKLINKYGSITSVRQKTKNLKDKLSLKFNSDYESVKLSRSLIKLVFINKLVFNDYTIGEINTEQLKLLFNELEFKNG